MHISRKQGEALLPGMMEDFEERALQHLRGPLAEATAAYPDKELRRRIREAVPRAERYGLTTEQQVVKFLDATFLLGEDFDQGEKYPTIMPLLRASDMDPETKANLLLGAGCSMQNRTL